MAKGGLGSWPVAAAPMKGAAPMVYENPGMFGLVAGPTDFLMGNLIDLIGKNFLEPYEEV